MNRVDCKIVQDLLPAYVEHLTSSETNNFVEEHIKECKECKKVLEIMEKENVIEEKSEKNKINYLKKYKRKMLILKIIVSFIIIAMLVVSVIKIKQWQFLSSIYEQNVEYKVGNNYKLTSIESKTKTTSETVYKNGKGYVKNNDESIIWEDSNTKFLIMLKDKKYFEIDKSLPPFGLDDKITIGTQYLFNTDNKNELMKNVLLKNIDIHEEEYRNRKCYVVLYEGEKIWIDKDTKFVLRDDYEGNSIEYYVETNTVSDTDIALPDLTDYVRAR